MYLWARYSEPFGTSTPASAAQAGPARADPALRACHRFESMGL
jgi:hypothetical protein